MRVTKENFIKRFKRGKEDALEYVIDEYAGLVKAIIYNSLQSYNDPHLIEEGVSDTFMGAFENAKQFNGDPEDFRKWICTIAKFKAIDKQRSLAKTPVAAVIDEQQLEVKSAEDEFLIQSSTEELLSMMAKLPQMDRDIFTMKYFLNMRNDEIAKQLGVTKASVDNRLYRGKKRLQQFHMGGVLT
ncbi:DNA-directed RNA polymerase sigma-70 factor [Sporosarcina sp. NCCP-2222]|uniref:sigma-70 family RNA polymerase sigma factor n=1 Tax=Sporosarcina sp. NCCP-2222 TaxID=2935073 RepID=UPI0020822DFF|nr:sigma-70 family RNA polymerase sigma factor [Sporosarcina sp. NCCP-2222]GKV57758.1 DNA-directed RNA polymerase sigma-70 factor [Sporosarcina sp. NCCP-2222]